MSFLEHNLKKLNTHAKGALIYIYTLSQCKPNSQQIAQKQFPSNSCCKLVRTEKHGALLKYMVEYPIDSGAIMELLECKNQMLAQQNFEGRSKAKYYFMYASDETLCLWCKDTVRKGTEPVTKDIEKALVRVEEPSKKRKRAEVQQEVEQQPIKRARLDTSVYKFALGLDALPAKVEDMKNFLIACVTKSFNGSMPQELVLPSVAFFNQYTTSQAEYDQLRN